MSVKNGGDLTRQLMLIFFSFLRLMCRSGVRFAVGNCQVSIIFKLAINEIYPGRILRDISGALQTHLYSLLPHTHQDTRESLAYVKTVLVR